MRIDFMDIAKFDPSFADYFLDEPEECLKALDIAAEIVVGDDLNGDFRCRVYGLPNSTKIPISLIRANNIGKHVTIEGIIKARSSVKACVVSSRFECPSCGTVISVLQLNEDQFKEPIKCGCGRKGQFSILSKETVDTFSMVVEEPTDKMEGNSQLSSIKIRCRGGLTEKEIERKMNQGTRVEVSGILKEIQIVKGNGKLTSKIDWYLDANYIKPTDDSFINLECTDEDLKKFKEFSKRDDWLEVLRESIFYTIEGHDDEKDGIIFQMFGGVGNSLPSMKERGTIHILLVGDPGGAKSSLLKVANQFAPKSRYVAGKGVTGAGIIGAVVKDELLGGFACEAGAFPLCHNGLLCFDELDKFDEKDALHQPMSDESVNIDKGGIHATFKAETSMLAAANPKEGTFTEYLDIYTQINLVDSIINRFDLIYIIRESNKSEDYDYRVAKKITSRNEDYTPELSKEFIQKYIANARTISPKFSEQINEFIAIKYKELRASRKANNEVINKIPISPRWIDSMRKLCQAIARGRLHKTISKQDAELAYNKLLASMKDVGINPNSGEVTYETMNGKTWSKADVLGRLYTLIRDRTRNSNDLISGSELIEIMASEGFDEEFIVEQQIDILKKRGDIFEPRNNQYKVM